jgi:hypothetical protein
VANPQPNVRHPLQTSSSANLSPFLLPQLEYSAQSKDIQKQQEQKTRVEDVSLYHCRVPITHKGLGSIPSTANTSKSNNKTLPSSTG